MRGKPRPRINHSDCFWQGHRAPSNGARPQQAAADFTGTGDDKKENVSSQTKTKQRPRLRPDLTSGGWRLERTGCRWISVCRLAAGCFVLWWCHLHKKLRRHLETQHTEAKDVSNGMSVTSQVSVLHPHNKLRGKSRWTYLLTQPINICMTYSNPISKDTIHSSKNLVSRHSCTNAR